MARLRVAVVKPDWGIRGGFELVVQPLVEHMRDAGHDVTVVSFDAWASDGRPFGFRLDPHLQSAAPDVWSYFAQIESCQRIVLDSADLVLSTQPPSFLVDHPRHLSLFYHHRRSFYELADYVIAAGQVGVPAVHRAAIPAIRRIDAEGLDRVTHVLAGSETVAERLRLFNHRSRGISVFHAGPALVPHPSHSAPAGDGDYALCVSRHDFPKRTELFVHAMHLRGGTPGVLVGSGGRLGWLRQLDERFARAGAPEHLPASALWLNPTVPQHDAASAPNPKAVRFLTDVDDDQLRRLFLGARCLVAPALLEDYGLTVIEAMQHGVPVIVCRDGGHLVRFVEHGVNGFVVEPEGDAIAVAVRALMEDRSLARRLGEAGRERAHEFTWARARQEFDDAIDRTLS